MLEGPKRLRSDDSSPPFNPDGAPVVLITSISKKQADSLAEVTPPSTCLLLYRDTMSQGLDGVRNS